MSLSLLSELNNSSLNELNKENNKSLNYKSKKIFKHNLGLSTSPINRRINSSNVKYNSSPKSYILKKNNSSSNYSNT